jgi:hypothetical protein
MKSGALLRRPVGLFSALTMLPSGKRVADGGDMESKL